MVEEASLTKSGTPLRRDRCVPGRKRYAVRAAELPACPLVGRHFLNGAPVSGSPSAERIREPKHVARGERAAGPVALRARSPCVSFSRRGLVRPRRPAVREVRTFAPLPGGCRAFAPVRRGAGFAPQGAACSGGRRRLPRAVPARCAGLQATRPTSGEATCALPKACACALPARRRADRRRRAFALGRGARCSALVPERRGLFCAVVSLSLGTRRAGFALRGGRGVP